VCECVRYACVCERERVGVVCAVSYSSGMYTYTLLHTIHTQQLPRELMAIPIVCNTMRVCVCVCVCVCNEYFSLCALESQYYIYICCFLIPIIIIRYIRIYLITSHHSLLS